MIALATQIGRRARRPAAVEATSLVRCGQPAFADMHGSCCYGMWNFRSNVVMPPESEQSDKRASPARPISQKLRVPILVSPDRCIIRCPVLLAVDRTSRSHVTGQWRFRRLRVPSPAGLDHSGTCPGRALQRMEGQPRALVRRAFRASTSSFASLKIPTSRSDMWCPEMPASHAPTRVRGPRLHAGCDA